MSFHFTTSIEKPDGIFHVRLYCIDTVTDLTTTTTGLMAQHMNALPDAVVVAPSLVLRDGLGEWAQEYENQFFQGTPSFDNFKLTMQADPVLAPLVKAVRSRSEIWCEVVLEQKAMHIPEPVAGEMFFPRKKRLYYWGKILLQETHLHLKAQQRNAKSYTDRTYFVAEQGHRDHYGKIDLTFIHWFKVLSAAKPDAFLNNFYGGYGGTPNATARYSQFLNAMVQWISPAMFYAVSDHRLKTTDKFEGTDQSISRCNFLIATWLYGSSKIVVDVLSGTLISDVHDLYHGGFALCDGSGNRWSLFDDSISDRGAYSFYNYATFGELLATFCEEFQLKFQIELPTLEESNLPRPSRTGNDLANRTEHWKKCSRWLFFDARIAGHPGIDVAEDYFGPSPGGGISAEDVKVPKPIYLNPLSDTVDADPCPSWVGKITVDDPLSGDDAVNHQTIIGKTVEGAMDISIKTMFAFVSYDSTSMFGRPVGPEILLFDGAGTHVFAHYFGFISIGTNANGSHFPRYSLSYNWTFWQAWRLSNLWGSDTCTIELDTPGIGIEPFGASSEKNIAGISDFGLYDFGEFPMFRGFFSNPSILLDSGEIGAFKVFHMKRTIGHDKIGTTHIKAVIVNKFQDTIVPPPPVPPAPPIDPPVITPPANIVENICGMINFFFGVVFADDVAGTTVTVDGTIFPSVVASAGGFIVAVNVVINACLLTVGIHTVCVTVTPADPKISPTTTCWNFNVVHGCCSDPTQSKVLHI